MQVDWLHAILAKVGKILIRRELVKRRLRFSPNFCKQMPTKFKFCLHSARNSPLLFFLSSLLILTTSLSLEIKWEVVQIKRGLIPIKWEEVAIKGGLVGRGCG